MATTIADIRGWLEDGLAQNFNFMIVVCDEFNHEDFPVYAYDAKDFDVMYDAYNDKGMQKIMEVYDLRKDFDAQLSNVRSWNYPADSKFNPGGKNQ